jgi:predicted  nucleic acid-binding Zn-ribbon protein
MNYEIIIQIITGHLNGKSMREIATELDISKDAAANVIKDWKNGKINFLQNAIPEESFIIDLAKYLKKAGIAFEEIPVALVQIKEWKDMAFDTEQIASIFRAFHGIDPNDVKDIVCTVTKMKAGGINYSELDSQVTELQQEREKLHREIREWEDKIGSLESDIKRKESTITDLDKQIESRNSNISSLKKTEDEHKDRISLSEKLWEKCEKLGINLNSLDSFMSYALNLEYKIDDVKYASSLKNFLDTNNKKEDILLKLNKKLDYIQSIGWDIESVIDVAESLRSTKRNKEDIKSELSDLEGALKSTNGQILLKLTEEKLFENQTDKQSSIIDKLIGTIRILENRKSKLEGEIKQESQILENIKEEQKAIEKQRKEAEQYVLVGSAILDFIKGDDIGESLYEIFNLSGLVESHESEIKMLRSSFFESVIELSKGEIAIIEYTDKKTMKIIDGREYENAQEVIKKAKQVEIQKEEIEKMINMYGHDHQSFIEDVFTGKADISLKFSAFFIKKFESVMNENINKTLQKILNSFSRTNFGDRLPVEIQLNGKIETGSIKYHSVIDALLNNDRSVTVEIPENSSKVEVPICRAIKFLLMDILDEEKGNVTRTKLRKIYSLSKTTKAVRDVANAISSFTISPVFNPKKRINH